MTKQASIFTATDELAQVLGEDLAKAFTDHRKALKKPMTGFAGQLMAKKLRGFPDPVAAVEQAILKGWSDVYPVEAPTVRDGRTVQPPRGMDALEQDLRNRIDEHRSTGERGRDPETLPAVSEHGWQGFSRPH